VDDFELIFTMLGERSTTELHTTKNSKGVAEFAVDARIGGNVAAVARKELEKQLGRLVVSKKNYLPSPKLREISLKRPQSKKQ
jgi:DNA-damage-inducible protein D